MGVSAENINPDLSALLAGRNEDFLDRINQLRAEKAAAEKALADLDVGKNVKNALIQANETFKQAQQVLDETKLATLKMVEEAQIEADAIRREAKEIMENAVKERSNILGDLEQRKASHKAWLDDSTAVLAKKKSELEDLKEELTTAKKAANAAENAARKQSDLAIAERQENSNTRTELEATLAKVREMMKSLDPE